MIDDVKVDAENKMKKTIDALKRELVGIRTGRASPALIEPLKVDYFGAPTPLVQLASIAAPEPRLLTIKPFDPSTLHTIEKAILKSELGITPMNDQLIGGLIMWIPGGLYFYAIISIVFFRWQQRDGVETRAGAQVDWRPV